MQNNTDIQLLLPYWTSWTVLISEIKRQQSPRISSQ